MLVDFNRILKEFPSDATTYLTIYVDDFKRILKEECVGGSLLSTIAEPG